MSLRALTWVLEEAPVDCPTCVLLLMGLADHVDEHLVAFPSVARLASYARCSKRTAQRHLRDLEEAGRVVPCWSPKLEQLPADRRPTAYRLIEPHGVNLASRTATARGDRLTPRRGDGVTPVTRRGDTRDAHGVSPVSPEPTNEPTNNPARGDSTDTPWSPTPMPPWLVAQLEHDVEQHAQGLEDG